MTTDIILAAVKHTAVPPQSVKRSHTSPIQELQNFQAQIKAWEKKILFELGEGMIKVP